VSSASSTGLALLVGGITRRVSNGGVSNAGVSNAGVSSAGVSNTEHGDLSASEGRGDRGGRHCKLRGAEAVNGSRPRRSRSAAIPGRASRCGVGVGRFRGR
jgi:hypothetical protein